MAEFEKNLDWLEAYLSGEMSESERIAAQAKIKENPEIQAQLSDLEDMYTVLKVHNRNLLKKTLQKADQETKSRTAAPKQVFMKYAIGIAASIILLFVAYWFLQSSSSPQELFAAHFEPYPNYEIVRGEENQNSFSKAMYAYDQNDYRNAISLMESLLEKESKQEDLLLYLGVAYLANQQTQSAIQTLQELHQLPSQKYEAQSNWYLAMAYLQSGNAEQAKIYLKKLIEESSTYQEKAQKILKQLP